MSAGPPPAAPAAQAAPAATGPQAATAEKARGVEWALLYGNFAIGCGVMVTAGSLNDIVRSLQVSVAAAGQLIAVGAIVMGLGAPLLAAAVGGTDRRRLLAFAMLWYAVGHALCALAPNYGWLMLLRAATVLSASVFTPQAAAALVRLVPPERQGQAITFIFLGWSLASVVGMPVHSYIGETFGWRWAFALVALLSAPAALWVWRALPSGVRPPSLTAADWRAALGSPALLAIVAVTAASGAGQFSIFSYFAPYFRQELQASPAEVSLLFGVFGFFGLMGNLWVARRIGKLGAARCVLLMLIAITLSIAAWPLAGSALAMGFVLVPWAFGCFSSNSAQQARLSIAAPSLASALIALNTSAIYAGQAIGAAGGGAIVAAHGYAWLPVVSLGWMALAIALSVWAGRQPRWAGHHG